MINLAHERALVALLTCHNRREKTVQCLENFESAAVVAGIKFKAVLVDDGSHDGTSDVVRARFPWVEVLHGDGSLFWGGGMRKAMEHALQDGAPKWLLWLNDDTMLSRNAIRLLMEAHELHASGSHKGVVVAGTVADPDSGELTYGGRRTKGWRRLSFTLINPEVDGHRCVTMNGNVVLFRSEIAEMVGPLDETYIHALGDFDYGLRATKLGVLIAATQAVVGSCIRNGIENTYLDRDLPLYRRWTSILSTKGIPPRAWLRFVRAHGGLLWPIYFLKPYLNIVLLSLRPRSARATPT